MLFLSFFYLVNLFLVVLVCLFACMLGADACVTLEGEQSKTFEEFQE
jgi:hypothetical protein